MKKNKLLAAAAALLLCLALLAGCNSQTDGEDTKTESPTSPELSNPSVSVDGPVYSGTDIADSPYVGRFESSYSALFASDAADVYVQVVEQQDGTTATEPVERPVLECRADGSISLTVMTTLGGEYATLNGTFTVDGEHAEFTVAQGNYGDFLGADTEKFSCRLLNENEIRYWGDQIGTVAGGDIFLRA